MERNHPYRRLLGSRIETFMEQRKETLAHWMTEKLPSQGFSFIFDHCPTELLQQSNEKEDGAQVLSTVMSVW